ncbi:MAG: hypothetical protein D4R96_02120, partial [Nitrosopumilaceae archaeon]
MSEYNKEPKFLRILKREKIVIRIIVLIFLGAGLHVLFLHVDLWNFTNTIYLKPIFLHQDTSAFFNGTHMTLQNNTVVAIVKNATSTDLQPLKSLDASFILYYVAYFVLTIVYSVSTSLIFKPKRIISPLSIQAVSIGIILIVIATPFAWTPSLVSNHVVVNNVIGWVFIISSILLITGFTQAVIVKGLVGMNIDPDGLERKAWSIDLRYDFVKKIILSEDFMSQENFRVKKYNKEKG